MCRTAAAVSGGSAARTKAWVIVLNGRLSVERLRDQWEVLRSSLWFIPSLMALGAVLLSIIVPEIDSRSEGDVGPYRHILFYGTASAARTILNVIASSVITVVSLVFSITLLTLQQASTQFTPRIMRTFMRDPLNQIVLGAFLSTFLYSVLVLRQVHGEDSPLDQFVPVLATTVAIMFAVVCLGLLVAYLNHAALLLNASTVVEGIHDDLLKRVERLHPSEIGTAAREEDDDLTTFRATYQTRPGYNILAREAGKLRSVDTDGLADAVPVGAWGIVHATPGDDVIRGTPLMEIGGIELDEEELDKMRDRVRNAFILGHERSIEQDALFAVRQLVDVGLKGIASGTYDPTTAEHVISALGDGLAELARREFPSRIRVIEFDDDDRQGAVTLWINRRSYEDFVDGAFSQIRRLARDDVHVILFLLGVLDILAGRARGARQDAVLVQVREIIAQLDGAQLTDRDHSLIQERAMRILMAAGSSPGA